MFAFVYSFLSITCSTAKALHFTQSCEQYLVTFHHNSICAQKLVENKLSCQAGFFFCRITNHMFG